MSLLKNMVAKQEEKELCSEAIVKVNQLLAEGRIAHFIPPFRVSGNWVNDSKGRGVCEMGESREALKDIAAALNAFVKVKEGVVESADVEKFNVDDFIAKLKGEKDWVNIRIALLDAALNLVGRGKRKIYEPDVAHVKTWKDAKDFLSTVVRDAERASKPFGDSPAEKLSIRKEGVAKDKDIEVMHNGENIGTIWRNGREVQGEHTKSGMSWSGGTPTSMAQLIKNHHDAWVKDQARKKQQGVTEGYWKDAVQKAEADREARKGKPFEKNPASHDDQGVYVGDKDLAGNPVSSNRKQGAAEGSEEAPAPTVNTCKKCGKKWKWEHYCKGTPDKNKDKAGEIRGELDSRGRFTKDTVETMFGTLSPDAKGMSEGYSGPKASPEATEAWELGKKHSMESNGSCPYPADSKLGKKYWEGFAEGTATKKRLKDQGKPMPVQPNAKGVSTEPVENVKEGSDWSPGAKETIKQDNLRSLKNLIALYKEKGNTSRVKELEAELKSLQGVAEGSSSKLSSPFEGGRKTASITSKHKPLVWENMLGTVMAKDPASKAEPKYFDYNWDDARAYAKVDQCDDLRICKSPGLYQGWPEKGKMALWGIPRQGVAEGALNEDEYDKYENGLMTQEDAVAAMFARLAKQGRDPLDMIAHRFGWSTHELDDLAQQHGFKNSAEWLKSIKQGKNISVGDYVQTAAGVEGVVKQISPDGKKLTIWNRKRQADHRVDITKAEKIPGIARRKMAEQVIEEGTVKDLFKIGGVTAAAIGLGILGHHQDEKAEKIEIGDQRVRLIKNPGWGTIPDTAMTLTGKDGKTYKVWLSPGKGSRVLLATPVENVKEQGMAEGYKEPTDAAGHAKMAAEIKKILDDTLADRGDRHGNPDPQQLIRAYEYHMKRAKENSQGVAEGSSQPELDSNTPSEVYTLSLVSTEREEHEYEFGYPDEADDIIKKYEIYDLQKNKVGIITHTYPDNKWEAGFSNEFETVLKDKRGNMKEVPLKYSGSIFSSGPDKDIVKRIKTADEYLNRYLVNTQWYKKNILDVNPGRGVREGSGTDLVYISDDRVEAFEDWMEREGLKTNVPKQNEGTYVVYDYSKADHRSKMYANDWNERKDMKEGSTLECPSCHSHDVKTYSDGEKECNDCHKTWEVKGMKESLLQSLVSLVKQSPISEMAASRTAEDLEVGDVVEIAGNVEHQGMTGEIIRFGEGKRFVVVNLYNGGVHSFHSSDVIEADLSHEDEDADDEENVFWVVFHDEDEEHTWIGKVSREHSTKWREYPHKGKPDYRWGASYMGYLEPHQVMDWIHKDYSRGVQIEGPFFSAEEAEEHARQHFGEINEEKEVCKQCGMEDCTCKPGECNCTPKPGYPKK